VRCIAVVDTVEDSLNMLLNRVSSAVLTNLKNIEIQYTTTTGAQLPNASTDFMIKQLILVKGWMQDLIQALKTSMTIGIVFAAVLVAICLVATFFDFRSRIMKMRVGVYTFRKEDAPLQSDTMFMGQFVATVMVGFLAIAGICIVVLTPLLWPVTWNLIWSMRMYYFGIILTAVIKALVNIMVKKFLFGPDYIRHRSLASIYIFYQTLITFVAGFLTAVLRFVFALLGMCASLPQLCYAASPACINQFYNLDAAHGTYLAACRAYHVHNNPIMISAVDFLNERLKARKTKRKLGVSEEQIRSEAKKYAKRWVMVILTRFPHLQMHRKAYLQSLQRISNRTGGARQDVMIDAVESTESADLSNMITTLISKRTFLRANEMFMQPEERHKLVSDAVEGLYRDFFSENQQLLQNL